MKDVLLICFVLILGILFCPPWMAMRYIRLLISRAQGRKENLKNAEISDTMDYLYGEVIDVIRDEDTGLSRIIMKNNKGGIIYGLSSCSVEELSTLYIGKGFVQVPLIKERKYKLNPTGVAKRQS